MNEHELWARVRAEMGRPSSADLDRRGVRDAIGFGNMNGVMERVFERALTPPSPDLLGPPPGVGQPVLAVIAPHDDFVYAGRLQRRVLPLLVAPTVIVIGVLHPWRRFGITGKLVFDEYGRWSTNDGDVPVSDLRARLIARLPKERIAVSAMVHDAEHSVEALLPWLRHAHPRVEIVPVLAATSRFEELAELADAFAAALGAELAESGRALGKDVALAISADAIHYGADFKQTRFGPGDMEAHARAAALDRALLEGPLAGAVTTAKVRAAYETWVDPESPGDYRWTWCGRFSIPFGLLALERLGGAHGWPLAYATSISGPPLDLGDLGFGVTAPATHEHFVGYPAAAYTAVPIARSASRA